MQVRKRRMLSFQTHLHMMIHTLDRISSFHTGASFVQYHINMITQMNLFVTLLLV